MTKQSPAKKRPRYGGAKDALMDAVVRVTPRVGLRGVTYRAVAEDAGVSHGAVTLHFGSRDALIEAAYTRAVENAISHSFPGPGTGRVEDFASALPQNIEDNRDSELFQYELALESTRRSELTSQVRRNYGEFIDVVARELHLMGFEDDPTLNRFVMASLDGMAFALAIGHRTRGETEQELARLREMLALLLQARAGVPITPA